METGRPFPFPDSFPMSDTLMVSVSGIRGHVGTDLTPELVARYAAKHGAAGGEWLAGIPGTIGGALAMNAGCYGGETWEHVLAVETVDRRGNLGSEEWFVSGVFVFQRGDEAGSLARMKDLLTQRVATQPINQPNAGSVFRNPPDDHAARLIESCGLKGYRVGGAQVSWKHANFIVNLGGATAADIEAVIEHVHGIVLARTRVSLVLEVRIVGRDR